MYSQDFDPKKINSYLGNGKRRRYPVERALGVGEALHVRVLGVRRLELVDVAVHERRGLVEVAAAADEVHQRVRVVLALADSLHNDGTTGPR